MKLIDKIKSYTLSQYVLRLLAGFMVPVLLTFMVSSGKITEKSFYEHLIFPVFVLAVAAFFVLFFFVKKDKAVYVVLLVSGMGYCCLTAMTMRDYMFSFGMCAVMFLLLYFFEIPFSGALISKKTMWIFCGAFIFFFTVFVGGVCCVYQRTYRTPCFDFGLFSQMFYYMKETGKCLITCERDKLLNHFAVHFSPVFYLLLPVYFLFPSPYTLLVAQALIVGSAVVPLVLLCKHFDLSNAAAVLFSGCLVLYTAFLGGCFYYLHENCFLTPFVLWLMYFLEKGKKVPSAAFALLTLSVKEDAAVYVAVIAFYYLLTSKKSRYLSAGILAFSVVYFVAVVKLMTAFGEGVMADSRFGVYIYDGGGLFSVIKSVLQNPANVIAHMFQKDKILYLMQITVGLFFLPFAIKKPAKLLLFVPLILVNLMPEYSYQHDIGTQYTFGSGALLFYLAVSNYSELGKNRSKILLAAVLSSLILFSGDYFKKVSNCFQTEEEKHMTQVIDEALSPIPEDASVCASAFLVPSLSHRHELYEVGRTERLADYIAGDLRYEREFDMDYYVGEGYEVIYFEEGIVAVLKSPAA